MLRKLAEKVATLSSDPGTQEKCELWKKHNALEKTRPLVFCHPENAWNGVIAERQMKCVGKLTRQWEMDL